MGSACIGGGGHGLRAGRLSLLGCRQPTLLPWWRHHNFKSKVQAKVQVQSYKSKSIVQVIWCRSLWCRRENKSRIKREKKKKKEKRSNKSQMEQIWEKNNQERVESRSPRILKRQWNRNWSVIIIANDNETNNNQSKPQPIKKKKIPRSQDQKF